MRGALLMLADAFATAFAVLIALGLLPSTQGVNGAVEAASALNGALFAQVHPFPGPGTKASETPTTGIVTSGLVAYWDLNTAGYNTATGKFTDFSGTGNDIWKGTDATATYDPVTDSNYTDFAADGQACDMPSDTASMSITGDITIEVVLYPTSTGGFPTVVGKGASSEFQFLLDTNRKVALVRNGTVSAYSTTAMAINTWHSSVVTCTGTAVAHYRNGAANGTGTTGTATDKTGVVTIGRTGTNYYRGRVARIRIYNRALTTEELTQNYNRDKTVLASRGIALP